MMLIGYFSTAAATQDAVTVHKILVEARVTNQRMGVTGLLVAGSNRYLQVIEGPSPAVECLYDSIRKDRRHCAVAMFAKRKIETRSFGAWSMAFRRPTKTGEPNVFDAILRAHTSQIEDENLQRQIRFFAHVNMSEQPPEFELGGSCSR